MNPKNHFKHVGTYKLQIGESPYRFCVLASGKGNIAWMRDDEEQHVNPQYREGKKENPLTLKDFGKTDIDKIIIDILKIKTKDNVQAEEIDKKYSGLVSGILNDLKKYKNYITNH